MNGSKNFLKSLFIAFSLNLISSLILIINNLNEKWTTVILGCLMLMLSVFFLITIGMDLYKPRVRKIKGVIEELQGNKVILKEDNGKSKKYSINNKEMIKKLKVGNTIEIIMTKRTGILIGIHQVKGLE